MKKLYRIIFVVATLYLNRLDGTLYEIVQEKITLLPASNLPALFSQQNVSKAQALSRMKGDGSYVVLHTSVGDHFFSPWCERYMLAVKIKPTLRDKIRLSIFAWKKITITSKNIYTTQVYSFYPTQENAS